MIAKAKLRKMHRCVKGGNITSSLFIVRALARARICRLGTTIKRQGIKCSFERDKKLYGLTV